MDSYDTIISLGLKCDVSYNLQRCFGFVESFPTSWVDANLNIGTFVNDMDKCFTGDIIEYREYNMWYCAKTNIAFHGTKSPSSLLGASDIERMAEKEDVISRTRHLIEKQKELWASEKRQLYILDLPTYKIANFMGDILNKIIELRNILSEKTTYADLLIIVDKETLAMLPKEINGVFLRAIDYFAPSDKNTAALETDLLGWNKIFAEFIPKELKTENKVYKFNK